MNLEAKLEDVLDCDISAAAPNWMVIGRQVTADHGGKIALRHTVSRGGKAPRTSDDREGRDMAFIDKTIEVKADIRDVYEAWTAFEDYPTFMTTVETVTLVPDDQLHWVAVVEDETFEWDADIVEHVTEEKIQWQAVDGRETGEVRFEKIGGGGTRVTYQLEYDPDAWEAESRTVRTWMERRVQDGLDAFKELMEGRAAA